MPSHDQKELIRSLGFDRLADEFSIRTTIASIGSVLFPLAKFDLH